LLINYFEEKFNKERERYFKEANELESTIEQKINDLVEKININIKNRRKPNFLMFHLQKMFLN
jgi:hypothetical protein